MRKLMVLLALTLAFGGVAACNRDKGPDSDPSNASDASQQSPEDKMRAFAECMRGHGIQMDDPETVTDEGGDTRTKVRVGPGPSGAPKAGTGPAPDDEQFKKAEQECRPLLPEGGQLGEGPSPEDEENMRNFSKCMRENGVENFPDPQPGGGINISPENGVNPEDPAFQEAEKKCQELMPRPADGPKVTS